MQASTNDKQPKQEIDAMNNAIDNVENEAAAILKKISSIKLVKAVDTKGGALVAAAKNIRAELKAAFPAVKFSVTSSRFAGGDSIDVGYMDGPISSDVGAIIGKYKAGSFDGMTDCYNYESSSFTNAFGDAKYISVNREYSQAMVEAAIKEVCEMYGIEVLPSYEEFKKGLLFSNQFGNYGMQELIYRAMSGKAGV